MGPAPRVAADAPVSAANPQLTRPGDNRLATALQLVSTNARHPYDGGSVSVMQELSDPPRMLVP